MNTSVFAARPLPARLLTPERETPTRILLVPPAA